MREPPQFPPEDIASQAHLVRLPLQPGVVAAIQQAAARRSRPLDTLALAHELGDVRFAPAHAPGNTGRPRWQGALSVFAFLTGERPALLGYSIHSLTDLRSVPPPASWPSDPINWDEAEETSLRARLERRAGLVVPFAVELWPNLRVIDPDKPPHGRRRVPRMREVDIARHLQAARPGLDRAAAYGTWLVDQVPGASLDPASVRITGENTENYGRSFKVLGLRLTGRLRVDDVAMLTCALVRGVGRRKAYGLGLLAIG